MYCHVPASWKINNLLKLCRVVLVCINSNVLIKVGPGKNTTVFCFSFSLHTSAAPTATANTWEGKAIQACVGPLSSRISRNLSIGLYFYSPVLGIRLCFIHLTFGMGRESDWLSMSQLSGFGSLWRRGCVQDPIAQTQPLAAPLTK